MSRFGNLCDTLMPMKSQLVTATGLSPWVRSQSKCRALWNMAVSGSHTSHPEVQRQGVVPPWKPLHLSQWPGATSGFQGSLGHTESGINTGSWENLGAAAAVDPHETQWPHWAWGNSHS